MVARYGIDLSRQSRGGRHVPRLNFGVTSLCSMPLECPTMGSVKTVEEFTETIKFGPRAGQWLTQSAGTILSVNQ